MNSIESLLGMIATEAAEAGMSAHVDKCRMQEHFLASLEHWEGRHTGCIDCEFSVYTKEEVKQIRLRMESGKTGGEA